MFTFWKTLRNSITNNPCGHPVRRLRPRVEALEHRRLLSGFGHDTIGVYNPTEARFGLNNSFDQTSEYSLPYGAPGARPVAGDWNGDGIDTLGYYSNGTFYLRNSNSPGPADIVIPNFGWAGCIPVAGDWNGDGRDSVGVYGTNAAFYLDNNFDSYTDVYIPNFGWYGCQPVAGDWNGDGRDTVGVYGTNATFYLDNNLDNTTDLSISDFGWYGCRPVAGDWNGDGIDTVGVFGTNAIFYLDNELNNTTDVTTLYGNPDFLPVAGNWDGSRGAAYVNRKGTLELGGSSTADTVYVVDEYFGSGVYVTFNGLSYYFPGSELTTRQVVFDGRGGPDSLDAARSSLRLTAYGSSGNDTLIGGSAVDQLFGGPGSDSLQGTVSEDYLDGGADNDTLTLRFNLDKFRANPGAANVPTWSYTYGWAGTDTFNVNLELGSFGRDVLQPFVGNARAVTGKMQPVINFLNREVPILASYYRPGYKFVDLAEDLGVGARSFLAAVDYINSNLDFTGLTGGLSLGSFQVTSPSSVTRVGATPTNPFDWILNPMEGKGIKVPLLRDGSQAVRLILGQDVDLVKMDLPRLNVANLGYSQTMYVPTPLFVTIEATLGGWVSIDAGATIGYDTRGLRTGNGADGFFAQNVTFNFSVTLDARIGASVVIAGVGVGGRTTGTVSLSLSDLNGDGKIRLGELWQTPAVSGTLNFQLYTYATIGYGWLSYTETWTLVSQNVNLF